MPQNSAEPDLGPVPLDDPAVKRSMLEAQSAARTFGYWHIRLARELSVADKDVGFAGVLKLLLVFETIYAYSAELAAGGTPE